MSKLEPATSRLDVEATDVGSVFVSNYPPYSFWNQDQVQAAQSALMRPPQPEADLGLYIHIPFCRKRCKFCYFRVYTDRDKNQIGEYLDALAGEVALYAAKPAVAGRGLRFVYFGGGTPSYLSVHQLSRLVQSLKASISWQGAREVTFECEPGTLSRSKLELIRDMGTTRLSLGIENFNDAILEANGRAHLSAEIYRVRPWIRDLGFEQVNVDLIAGMVGETWDTWRETVEKTIDFEPESVTLYQMELPYNTVFSKGVLEGSSEHAFADWRTKREWHAYAFERLAAAGYEMSSAYTMIKKGSGAEFVYRDSVWHGTDMIGAGVASFSHMSGVHFQNFDRWDPYLESVSRGELPLARACVTTPRERLTREVILQLKTGSLKRDYFQKKFTADIVEEFAGAFSRLADEELLEVENGDIRLTPPGLLRVDQLLPEFYEERYQGGRYT